MEQFFTAKEARQMMEINNAEIINVQMTVIFKSITEQVNRGLDSVCINTDNIPNFYLYSRKIIESLKNLGYIANHESNQRDGSYLNIKW